MSDEQVADTLRRAIRSVPDWPRPGIMFRDITPLLSDARLFRLVIEWFVDGHRSEPPDFVAGIDARGFILGAVVAHELGVGFIPIRKRGKLPYQTLAETYELEYGNATIEVHVDACGPGHRVLLVDDLVATGGTMIAAARLLVRLGADVAATAAIVDLPDLGGSTLIRDAGFTFDAICTFEGH